MRAQVLAKVAKNLVRQALPGALHKHQARVVASRCRLLCNEFWRKAKIKILQAHNVFFTRV
jgi:hypothetical protein